jgi:hypothetical protein
MINRLLDSATWDNIMYRIVVSQCIEAGARDADSDNVSLSTMCDNPVKVV